MSKKSDLHVPIALALMAMLLVGCGSGGDSPGGSVDAGGPGGVATGSGTLTWFDDGSKHTALYPSAARVISSSLDMVQLAGGDPVGFAVALGVSVPPPLVPGTYACGVTGDRVIGSLTYTVSTTNTLVYESCSIQLTSLGDKTGGRAVGAFSAILTLPAGGTKAITNGVFDVPLTVNSP